MQFFLLLFTSRVGNIALALLVGFVSGIIVENRRGDAAAQAERIAYLEADVQAQKAIAASASARQLAAADEAAALFEKVNEYEDSLSKRPACGLDGADVRSLREILSTDVAATTR
jgi:hypothetical protein